MCKPISLYGLCDLRVTCLLQRKSARTTCVSLLCHLCVTCNCAYLFQTPVIFSRTYPVEARAASCKSSLNNVKPCKTTLLPHRGCLGRRRGPGLPHGPPRDLLGPSEALQGAFPLSYDGNSFRVPLAIYKCSFELLTLQKHLGFCTGAA